jgi:Flp pilus assembly protein TadD
LRICAWVFSNCNSHLEAAAAYRAILDRESDWIEGYRHLSGALAAGGLIEEAVQPAIKAVEGDPGEAEFAGHAGSLLLRAGRGEEALRYFEHAVMLRPDDAPALCALASSLAALGQGGRGGDAGARRPAR